LAALLLAAMTLVTFVQVILRYVFNAGFVWVLALTIFLVAWLVLFGMSCGASKASMSITATDSRTVSKY